MLNSTLPKSTYKALCARLCCRCFVNIYFLNPYDSSVELDTIISLQMRQDTERLINLLKVTQLVRPISSICSTGEEYKWTHRYQFQIFKALKQDSRLLNKTSILLSEKDTMIKMKSTRYQDGQS